MFTRSHFSLKLPTYVETIFTRQLHDLIVTKLCQNPGDRLWTPESKSSGHVTITFQMLASDFRAFAPGFYFDSIKECEECRHVQDFSELFVFFTIFNFLLFSQF